MSRLYFEILRPGINTTLQDKGRYNLFHFGIAESGAIDQRKFRFVNKLIDNSYY